MTWAQYTTQFRKHLMQYNRMQGVQDFIDLAIRTATADLQRALPWYQVNYDTVMVPALCTTDGYTMSCDLPQGSNFKFSVSNGTDEADLREISWYDLDTYRLGKSPADDRVFAVKSAGRKFTMAPPLNDDETLRVRYDGVKYDYTDSDTVPFDSLFIEAASHCVLADLSRRVDNDQDTYMSFMRSYGRLKAKLMADGNARLRSTN